ncbi:hypothetical protein LZ30DRAFT_742854 [Colletotrichum cereale]|nr:hypothetical protein LZ30DRAFT_742854 [Colletotrichum cereale]
MSMLCIRRFSESNEVENWPRIPPCNSRVAPLIECTVSEDPRASNVDLPACIFQVSHATTGQPKSPVFLSLSQRSLTGWHLFCPIVVDVGVAVYITRILHRCRANVEFNVDRGVDSTESLTKVPAQLQCIKFRGNTQLSFVKLRHEPGTTLLAGRREM